MTFKMIPTLDGYEVDDLTTHWWAELGGWVYWSDRPWTLSPGDDHQRAEDDIARAGGTCWSAYVERRRVLPEGVALLTDPQVFTGLNWILLDPAKRVGG
jgi:hypothetical protein